MVSSSICFIWLIENSLSSCLKRSLCWPVPKWLMILVKVCDLLPERNILAPSKACCKNFNGHVHPTFLHVQVLTGFLCTALAPNIFVLSVRAPFRVYSWQESLDLHFARRVEANKNPDCTDPCSHDCPLEFQHPGMTTGCEHDCHTHTVRKTRRKNGKNAFLLRITSVAKRKCDL